MGYRLTPSNKNRGQVGVVSAPQAHRADWLDGEFWDRLDRLESRHKRLRSEHEIARRCLDRVASVEVRELQDAWLRYCAVIAELDRTTDEFAALNASRT